MRQVLQEDILVPNIIITSALKDWRKYKVHVWLEVKIDELYYLENFLFLTMMSVSSAILCHLWQLNQTDNGIYIVVKSVCSARDLG